MMETGNIFLIIVLLGISELLGSLTFIKANGILQLAVYAFKGSLQKILKNDTIWIKRDK